MTQLNSHNKPLRQPPPSTKLSTVDLPVLTKITDAYKLWHSWLPHLTRLSRNTLGLKIETLFIEVIEFILLAGYTSRDQKIAVVARASSKLDLLKFFLQLIWEMKVLDTQKYQIISPPLLEVGMMLGGWRRQLLTKETPA